MNSVGIKKNLKTVIKIETSSYENLGFRFFKIHVYTVSVTDSIDVCLSKFQEFW